MFQDAYRPEEEVALIRWAQARAAFGEGRMDEAATLCKEAVGLAPKLEGAWLVLGHALSKKATHRGGATPEGKGYCQEAVDAFKKAVEVNPKSAIGWTGLGYAYLHSQQDRQGCTAFQTALGIDSRDAPAWWGLGCCLERLQREAKGWRRFLGKVTSRSERAWNAKRMAAGLDQTGDLYCELGDKCLWDPGGAPSEAVTFYREAIRRWPLSQDPLRRRSRAYMGLFKALMQASFGMIPPAEAIHALKVLRTFAPSDADDCMLEWSTVDGLRDAVRAEGIPFPPEPPPDDVILPP